MVKIDYVEAMMPLTLKTWATPDHVIIQVGPRPRQEGISPLPTMALVDIPDNAFHALVEEWVSEMYRKAKKTRQAEAACGCDR